jgi:hypothetical protein
MQLGRIPNWRTIQHASRKSIILNEHEVGALLIKHQDVEHIEKLLSASEHIERHVVFLLEQLKSDMAYNDYGESSTERRWGFQEPRSIIRDIEGRVKNHASLMNKAIVRHEEREKKSEKDPKTYHPFSPYPPLVERIVRENMYNIRDIAGVRVTCDYISDIYKVVEAICAKSKDWDIEIIEKQDAVGILTELHSDLHGVPNPRDHRTICMRKRRVCTPLLNPISGSISIVQTASAQSLDWGKIGHGFL